MTAILIRARLVVQVHPGPPFKSPVNTRLFSLFPFRGISPKNHFAKNLRKVRVGYSCAVRVRAATYWELSKAAMYCFRDPAARSQPKCKASPRNARNHSVRFAFAFVTSHSPLQALGHRPRVCPLFPSPPHQSVANFSNAILGYTG